MPIKFRPLRPFVACFILLTTTFTAGCPEKKLTAFDPDGVLEVNIRRTAFGVPHIVADNLESMSFGVGYAFAQDNICVLEDLITKYNSRRSRYFGPDRVPGSGDAENLINDFGYLALEVRAQAEAKINSISENQRALISGYTKGVNYYLDTTGSNNIDPTCAGKPFVQPVTELDLLTALLSIALLPGSSQFLAPIFLAAPPGQDFKPYPASAAISKNSKIAPLNIALQPMLMPEKNPLELGSNGWALGREKTENGRGMLLANPHFPHTGNLRFWQFHTTIPGVLNVMGSSLAGTPGMVNIGFTDNMAWTHTFSAAEHFIVYQLTLNPDASDGLTYQVDGANKTITRKTLTTQVAVAPGVVIPFSKDVYYSDFGPILVVPEQFPWGHDATGQFTAFAIKDVNSGNTDVVDHWLAMNLARNMDEFKATFQRYNGVIFNNTLAVDPAGNAFYIDDSTVPDLNPVAESALRTNPQLIQLRKLAGFSILPGNSALFDFSGAIPYERAPKLDRNDYVQNSNDSFWLTNPEQPITDVSILYGQTGNAQTLRSRMSQRMLQDSAGDDHRFSPQELERALFSYRSYLGESVLPDLLALCQSQGDTAVQVDTVAVNIAPACAALAQWDGLTTTDSRAAHLFREFAQQFSQDPQWQVPFDPASPLDTPNSLLGGDKTLQQFARAILNIEAAGLTLDATLGEMQFVERSGPDGLPSGERLPWSGGNNLDGGFNVFRPVYGQDGSLQPRHVYEPLPGTQLSADAGGYPVEYGSSWMMTVSFTRHGPKARGLMTYSQSTDPDSPHALDQSRLYSEHPRLYPVPFTEKEIAAHTLSSLTLRLDTRPDQ